MIISVKFSRNRPLHELSIRQLRIRSGLRRSVSVDLQGKGGCAAAQRAFTEYLRVPV